MASEPSSNLLSKIGRHLAHELNNPISAIASSAYLIQDMIASADGTIATEEIRPFVESIQEECTALKATVEEFSKFATTERILAAPIDLSEFLGARTQEMQRDGTPVTASVPKEQCFVNADSAGLAFVLRTLAVTAREEGATSIRFALSRNGNECTIEMMDNRTEEGDLSSEFSAESVATRPRGSGLGLKLPLAKKIVELHGGTIQVSEGKNAGSVITVKLPSA